MSKFNGKHGIESAGWSALGAVALGLGMAASFVACSDPQPPEQAVLRAPVALSAVDGEVCVPPVVRDDGTVSTAPMPRCEDSGAGFSLVVNQRSQRVGVMAIGQDRPRWINLDARRPGITGIAVGTRPVDLAISGGGTAAAVVSESDNKLTGIDLWTFRPLMEAVELQGTPRAVEAIHGDDGEALAVLLAQPNAVQFLGSLSCDRPGDEVDRRDHDPAETCAWAEGPEAMVELVGRPMDMAVDPDGDSIWVAYGDRNEVSQIGLSGECLNGEAAPPCEVRRVAWDLPSGSPADAAQGATKVDVDPLGLFVYALDRLNNQLVVIDRRRGQVIRASRAMEPVEMPFGDEVGIPLVRSASALSAEAVRGVIFDGTDGDDAIVFYQVGARVAATNGEIYRIGVVDFECRFDGEVELEEAEFIFDPQRRGATDEARCLEIPAFPLGGNPDGDDDETLRAARFVDVDAATTVGMTPIFGIRDANPDDSTVAATTQCELPSDYLEALREELGDDLGAVVCDSPEVAQPLAPSVETDGLTSLADEPRAALMQFAWALFGDDGEEILERRTYDARIVQEDWRVIYEGALPRTAQSANGLVSREDDALFVSGGIDYCTAGVEVGDRLTIVSSPNEDSGCAVFEADDPAFRTWEVTEVEAYRVHLAVIDGEETIDELPRRSCFDRGLRYEVRPHQAWVVVGDQSGMSSPWVRDGDQCVAREGAEDGWFQGRVATGDEYRGRYLRFRLHPGAVEPTRGLAHTLSVRRNYRRDALASSPTDAVTTPAQLLFTPDVGAGRYLTMVDAGGNRIYLRNISFPDRNPIFMR